MIHEMIERSVFKARARAFMKARLDEYNGKNGEQRMAAVLDDVARYAKYNEEGGIPQVFNNVCYGISWSINSGRVNGQTVLAIRALKVSQLLALIYDVAICCNNMGEYPKYLMERYTTVKAI